MIFFDERVRVTAVYLPETDIIPDEAVIGTTAVCFDDYQWDKITEAGLPVTQLAAQITTCNKIITGNQTVSLIDAKNELIQQYKKIY